MSGRRLRDGLATLLLALWLTACAEEVAPPTPSARSIVGEAARATAAELRARQQGGLETWILRVQDGERAEELARAARAVREAGLHLGYWIEVARAPSLADAHPETMATLQGHDEWRRVHTEAPHPAKGEVVRVWPWVPVASREGFDLQLARVGALLERLPPAELIYLHGLQHAPSACGCGHPLCRWTSSYFLANAEHPEAVQSFEVLGPEAAADFLEALEPRAHGANLVPVFTPECGPDDADCHGVPCFAGRCWPALREQWDPLVARRERLALYFPSRSIDLAPDPELVATTLRLLAPDTESRARITVFAEAPTAGLAEWIAVEDPPDASWRPR